MLEFAHKSVMPQECIDALHLKDGGVYFDGTVGGGGHCERGGRRDGAGRRLGK
jgi:16S rRNA (cytosine1402-N4)-methyltransferase